MVNKTKQIFQYSIINSVCLISLLFCSLIAVATTDELPVEQAVLTAAPQVPPPIKRDHSVKMVVNLDTVEKPVASLMGLSTLSGHSEEPYLVLLSGCGRVMKLNFI